MDETRATSRMSVSTTNAVVDLMCRESLCAFAKDMSLASLQVAEGDFAGALIGRNGQKAVVVRKGKAR